MQTPRPTSERLIVVDAARGVAILGVLLVNVIAMTGPQGGMQNPYVVGPVPLWDVIVFLMVRVFVEGKFISMFCLLFGIGLALQTGRIEATGASSTPTYLRRQTVLALMGVFHGVLLWWGDILFPYAVLGMVAYLFRNQSLENLRVLAWLLVGFGTCAVSAGLLSLAAIPPEAIAVIDEAMAAITLPAGLPPWAYTVLSKPDLFEAISAIEIGVFQQGPWQYSFGFRALLFLGTSLGTIASAGFMLLGLMLLGISLVKDGFLEAASEARRRTWMIRGLLLGVGLEVIGNTMCLLADFDLFTPLGLAGEALRQFGKPPLALCFFALLISLGHRGVLKPFVAAGRLALTNYIGQSLVMAVLMMHWGFGLFGTLGRTSTFGIAVAVLAAQVLLSNLWMMRFDRGPLEYLWRRATYIRSGAPIPNKSIP